MADLISGGIIPVTGGVPLNNIVVYTTESRWVPVDKGLPEKSETYLCTVKGLLGKYITLAKFADDLSKVDCDFESKKGVSGFYNYDSEYGYYIVNNVLAWMPIPEPYRGGD